MPVSNIVVQGLIVRNEFGHNRLDWQVVDPNSFSGSTALQLDQVEIWASTTNSVATATKVVEARNSAIHASVVEGATYYYWARARDLSGSWGAYYPAGATSGVPCLVVYANSAAQNLANITISVTANAGVLTAALKTLSGDDPSPLNPIVAGFRSTAGDGSLVYRQAYAALQASISNGSNMGVPIGGFPFRLWLLLIDDNGTLRLGLKNCSAIQNNDSVIFSLAEEGLISSVAEGGAGAADSYNVVYTDVAVTNKPFRRLGYVDFNVGLATAGVWSVANITVYLAGLGGLKPGDVVQDFGSVDQVTGQNTTTIIPWDTTIPQISEGALFADLTLTPVSPCNFFDFEILLNVRHSVASEVILALFRDSAVNAIAAAYNYIPVANAPGQILFRFRTQAASLATRVFEFRFGAGQVGTMSINSTILGNTPASYIRAVEIAG